MIDPQRHYPVFQPERFNPTLVSVIGAGAVGSYVTFGLAKTTVTNIEVYDSDRVEGHNLANQLYGPHDIGKLKVDALAEWIFLGTGTTITKHPRFADKNTAFGPIVFLMTDTMKSRKEIFYGAIKNNRHITRMFEGRMGVDTFRIYSIDPNDPAQVRGWESSLYDDTQTIEGACGSRLTLAATASIEAGHAVWAFLSWWQHTQEGPKILPNEIIVYLNPPFIQTQVYR